MSNFFETYNLCGVTLPNRMVMAPMTRSRADNNDAPTDLTAEYYSQRAGAGVIITEGVQPNAEGKGYPRTPGIYSPEQIAGWKKVTEAVSAHGGRMVMQLMHVGRIAHQSNKSGARTLGPSAIQAPGQIMTPEGLQDHDVPVAMSKADIATTIADYKTATQNALDAGFIGVELHVGSGYLPNAFLSPNSNQRDDEYGGSAENRSRFTVEALKAMIEVAGADRVGIRIAPGFVFNDMKDDNPVETYTALLKAVDALKINYVHVITPPPEASYKAPENNVKLVRDNFSGTVIAASGYTKESGEALLERNGADLVAFGKAFIANPDLVERFKQNHELNAFDVTTFYTGEEKGYTDYPAMGAWPE